MNQDTQNMKDEIMKRVDEATVNMMTSNSKELTVQIDYNGKAGIFSFKYPTLIQRMKIGINTAKFLDGVPREAIDVTTDNIAYMFSTLMVVLSKCPTWFNLDTMDDYELLELVYERYREWSDNFRGTNQSSRNEGNSGTKQDEESLEDNEDVPDAD